MFSTLLSPSVLKSVFQKSLLVTSIAALAACGSDDEDSFISPVNDELVTISSDAEPAGFAYESGVNATYYADESYGADERNKFDIFLPESEEPTGLVIYIHGGGFFTGDKALAIYDFDSEGTPTPNASNIADINDVLEAGHAFATINYSLLDVPGFNGAAQNDTEGLTKPLSDIREALQYIRYNAKTFNIAPEKVATYGVSAGAVSSLWLAYSDDMIDVDSEDPIAQQSTRISAAGAIETQGSLDLVRWEEILSLASVTLEQAAELGGLPFMQSVYGLPAETAAESLVLIRAESGELADYRATLDLPALIDSSDAPVYVSNTQVGVLETSVAFTRISEIPGEIAAALLSEDYATAATLEIEATSLQSQLINALLHFPTHAQTIKNYATQAGAEVVANIPTLGDPDQTQQTAVSFLLENLQ